MTLVSRLAAPAAAIMLFAACEQTPPDHEPGPVRQETDSAEPLDNPLEERYLTPFRTPPFHRLEPAHFLPALNRAIDEAESDIEAIAADDSAPTFANTVEALERSGADLSRIARTFYGLAAVSADPEMGRLSAEFSTRLAEHNNRVLSNTALHERVAEVADRAGEDLDAEQQRLVQLTRERFRRAGANLPAEARESLRGLNARLAALEETLRIRQRQVIHDFELVVSDSRLIEQIPSSLAMLAQRNARDRGHTEGWVFTLHTHSLYPFLRHFPDRDKRRELYQAWMDSYTRSGPDEQSLQELMHRIARLRARRAELLGYDSHIDFVLADSSIGNRENLRGLIDRVADAAAPDARRELERLERLARSDGIEGPLEPWDRWYYAERLREAELSVHEQDLRRFFAWDRVRDGLFSLANRLWGLSFHPHTDIPAWHLDVEAVEVRDAMGEHLGILYLDPLHRAGKRGGAWTSTYRVQHYSDGERIAPVVANVANLTPAAAGLPALLSPEEVRTVFHEFGHALHALFSDVEYAAMAGTAVPGDFVEFPAVLLEHWALAPEVLRMYAYEQESGAMIGDQAVAALQQRDRLTAGLETLEYLAAIEMDIAMHGVPANGVPELEAAERTVAGRLDLPGMLSAHHHGTGMISLFADSRRSGDFRTLWAEMLAADAFAAFEDTSLLDRNLADQLRQEVLSRGNARDPMDSWRAFRDRDPEPEYLLRARGLTTD